MIPNSRIHRGPTFGAEDGASGGPYTFVGFVGDARGTARSAGPTVVPRFGPQIPVDPAQENPFPPRGGMIPNFRNHRGPTFGAEDGASGGPYTFVGFVGDARGTARSAGPTVVPRLGPQKPMDPARKTHPPHGAG